MSTYISISQFIPVQMAFLLISYGTLPRLEPLEHAEGAMLTTQRLPINTDLELMLERMCSKQTTKVVDVIAQS